MDQPEDHRVGNRAQKVGGPADRGHERVLERALPALDLDGLRDPAEDHREVVPEDRAHHQRHEQAVVAGLLADSEIDSAPAAE